MDVLTCPELIQKRTKQLKIVAGFDMNTATDEEILKLLSQRYQYLEDKKLALTVTADSLKLKKRKPKKLSKRAKADLAIINLMGI